MRKTVGYFEGTDSPLLTALICDGYDTIPISNGYDNHGAHVRMINQESQIDLPAQGLRARGGQAGGCHLSRHLSCVPDVWGPSPPRDPH